MGRIQAAERVKPTLQQLDSYNLTNLLSACSADTGLERKGDFHVKATPAASRSRTTQETSQSTRWGSDLNCKVGQHPGFHSAAVRACSPAGSALLITDDTTSGICGHKARSAH